MTVIQKVYLEGIVSMEADEAQAFEETRVLPNSVLERGVTVSANGAHFIAAANSWSGDDINFQLEDALTLSASFVEEAEAEDELEPEDESEDAEESLDEA